MSMHNTRWTADNPPNTLLAIDPGARLKGTVPYAGCALFQWGMLARAVLVKCPTTVPLFAQPFALVRAICKELYIPRWVDMAAKKDKHGERAGGEPLTALAVERPIIYAKGAARPEDILDLREIYGAIVGGIEADFYAGPTPGEWKGSIDDAIVNERMVKILNMSERLIVTQSAASGQGGMTDHVLNAVGLGLFTLGRSDKAGVVPGGAPDKRRSRPVST